MRVIGHLPSETEARTFGDYLYVQGIENQVEFSKEDGWTIWVNEEEKLQTASELLSAFRRNPTDAKYHGQAKTADDLRSQKTKAEEAWRKRLHDRRHLFRPLTAYGFGPLTFVLIAASVGVAILSQLGNHPEKIQSLFITNFMVGDMFIPPGAVLEEIRHGQLWRLITPIFIHFGALHLLFNMLWLRDLGSMIEGRQSTLHLAALVVVIAAISNVAQFLLDPTHNPLFGGMSGVLYGLLGYIWIRGKLDPGSGLYLHQSTIIMMLIWLVLCFTGWLGHVANICHVSGLVLGMAWGWLSSLRYR